VRALFTFGLVAPVQLLCFFWGKILLKAVASDGFGYMRVVLGSKVGCGHNSIVVNTTALFSHHMQLQDTYSCKTQGTLTNLLLHSKHCRIVDWLLWLVVM